MSTRERFSLAPHVPSRSLANLVGLTLWAPPRPAESEFGLDEERVLKSLLDRAERVDRALHLTHGTKKAQVVEHFGKRPGSMGVSELLRVLRWLEDGFDDVL